MVRGKNRPVSRHLRALAREKATRIARLTHDAGRVEIDFSEIRNPREARPQECEVTVHLKRHFVKARASATDPEAALDLVLDKVEQQVARIKDKRVTRVHDRRTLVASNGHAVDDVGGSEPVATDVDEAHDDTSRIVRTKVLTPKPMTPEEATLQMELLGHAFFLFANSESGRAAVLYRRRDGDLGLIETTS